MRSQFSCRRMAYFQLPLRGIVFATTPTGSMSIMPTQSADLTLSVDTSINQGLIEYETWLENAVSILRETFDSSKDPQSYTRCDLIEEIMLATEEVNAAKREEWSRQLAVIHTHNPLPPSVITSQCAVVDGGKSLLRSSGKDVKTLSREIPLRALATIGPHCPMLSLNAGNLLPCHERLHRAV